MIVDFEPSWIIRLGSTRLLAEKLGMDVRADLFDFALCILFRKDSGKTVAEGKLDYIEPLVIKYQGLKAFL